MPGSIREPRSATGSTRCWRRSSPGDRDRETAFERLAGALDATVVLGVVTNLRFLRWLVRQPVVLAGEARTDTLDRIWPPDDWGARTEIPDGAWRTAAAALAPAGEPADPWAGGWRLNAAPTLTLTTEGLVRSVPLDPPPALPSEADAFEAVRAGDTVHVDLAGRSTAFRIAPPPDVDATARAAAAHGHASASGPVELVAPMPGAVLRVHAAVGAAVAAGDPVVTLEAMKMEHVVVTSIAGRIADLRVRAADQVTRGQLLAVVEP